MRARRLVGPVRLWLWVHYQALFAFLKFADENQGLFAPAADGQGCGRGACGFSPIPEAQIAGLLAYLRKL